MPDIAELLDPLITELENTDEPGIARAQAAQAAIVRLEAVRDDAIRTAWDRRYAGQGITHLAKAIGVSDMKVTIAINKSVAR